MWHDRYSFKKIFLKTISILLVFNVAIGVAALFATGILSSGINLGRELKESSNSTAISGILTETEVEIQSVLSSGKTEEEKETLLKNIVSEAAERIGETEGITDSALALGNITDGCFVCTAEPRVVFDDQKFADWYLDLTGKNVEEAVVWKEEEILEFARRNECDSYVISECSIVNGNIIPREVKGIEGEKRVFVSAFASNDIVGTEYGESINIRIVFNEDGILQQYLDGCSYKKGILSTSYSFETSNELDDLEELISEVRHIESVFEFGGKEYELVCVLQADSWHSTVRILIILAACVVVSCIEAVVIAVAMKKRSFYE